MSYVRRLSFLGCIALLAGSMTSLVGCVIPTSQYTRSVTQEIETTPLLEIDVTTSNGPISVESHAEPFVALEITYRANGTTQSEAQKACEQLDTTVEANDGRLTIKAVRPSGIHHSSISYQLKVPAGCDLRLKTSNGRITASGIDGKVSAETSNGSVSLLKIHDDMVVRTSNGSIAVEQSSGSIDLKTSNGRVNASGRFRGHENRIQTSNGAVTLSVAADRTTEVTASTSNATISCSVNMLRTVEQGKHDLHAILGDGDADQPASRFTIKTSNGSVRIVPIDARSPSSEEVQREA